MIKFGILILSLIYFSTNIAFGVEFSAEQKMEYEPFKESVFPFLRKNCAECHRENADEPVGPSHSHSDPEQAFLEFQKHVSFKNLVNSKIWRLGADQHHCVDYEFNCEQADLVESELKEVLDSYVSEVISLKEKADLSDAPVGQKIGADSDLIEMEFSEISDLSNGRVQLKGKLLKMGTSNSYILAELNTIGSAGMFRLKGLRFKVNGRQTPKLTGYERIDRNLIFGSDMVPRVRVLSLGLGRPSIELNPGDRLSVEIDHFEEILRIPTKLCQAQSQKYFKTTFLDKAQSMPWFKAIRLLSTDPTNELEICLRLESEIDFASVRRSPILARGPFSGNEMNTLLTRIDNWIRFSNKKNGEPQKVVVFEYEEDLAKGKYLFSAAGCINCHGSDLSGGIEFNLGKDGKLYSPNITPHGSNGIAGWSSENFFNALTKGESPSWRRFRGASYYPVFPYTSYAKLSKEDISLIKYYLDRFSPNPKANKKSRLNGLASVRTGLIAWKMARSYSLDEKSGWFIGLEEYQPISEKSATWNRGAYLINGALHCAQCHTPRQQRAVTRGKLLPYNVADEGEVSSSWLKGGKLPTGKKVPGITKMPNGNPWPTLNDVDESPSTFKAKFLSVFKEIDYEKMQIVYRNQLRHLSPEDLSAIGEYLNDPDPFE